MAKRVLITGAAGFLGSHLCDRFIKEGFNVIGMDNLITGDLKNIRVLPSRCFQVYSHPRRAGLYFTLCITSQSHRLFKNSDSNIESWIIGHT
jgi:nucleoside-diphosphate-sugar epimerase